MPLMGAYLVTGFVALEGVDQLVSYEILPVIAYKIALVFYVFGIPGSLTIAWFHGAKGRQDTPKAEILIQAVLFVFAVIVSVIVFRNDRQEQAVAAATLASGLEADQVAVLYFEDFSSGGDLGYVADGITEALIDELVQKFEATVDPPMQMVRALPHLGLIPLFIIWFGIGELPKVLLVALGVLALAGGGVLVAAKR